MMQKVPEVTVAFSEKLDEKLIRVNEQFRHGLKMKQRTMTRKWMEVNSLVNCHSLLLLPYQGMLTHMGTLVEERRKYFPLTNFADTLSNVSFVEGSAQSETAISKTKLNTKHGVY